MDDAVGTGEIDVFENAQGLSITFLLETLHTLVINGDNFPGLDFPHELGTYMVQGATFRGDAPSAVNGSEAKRTNTERVTNPDQFIFG